MNTKLCKVITPLLESKKGEKSWFDHLVRPVAPLIAAATLMSSEEAEAAGASAADGPATGRRSESLSSPAVVAKGAQFAGAHVAPSCSVGYLCINDANTSAASSRAIKSAPLVWINETTAITCAHLLSHLVLSKDQRLTVGTGAAVTTSPGTSQKVTVTNVSIFPGFSDKNSRTATPDLAILKLDSPVKNCTPIRIAVARPAVRSFVLMPNYSQAGNSSGQDAPSDAGINVKRAVVTGAPRFGEDSELYFNAEFNREPYRDEPASSMRDPGGGVFNEKGELVGLVAAVASYSFQVSTTILDLTNPRVKAEIERKAASTEAYKGTTGHRPQ